PTDVERTEAEQLKIVLKRSRQEMHISQQRGSGPDEGTDNEDDDNNKENQGLRIGEEERMQEEEDAEELYRDVNINQGWGLQVSQETEDTHVILTPTQSDAKQESSSTSSFMTNLLNPITDPGLESLFTTGSTTQMPEVVREAMQTQTNQLQDSIQRENDEFLKTIDENMKKIIKEQRSDEQRNLYKALVEAYDADKTILDTYGESTILKRRRKDDDQEGPSAGSNRRSKRQREGREHASASTPSEPATRSAGRSTTGSQSRQLSASESAFAEEPVQTTCQMEEPSYLVFETGADDQPIIQTTQHSEWFSQPKRPPTSDRDWNKFVPAAQGDAQSWISILAKQTDARSSFNELLDTPIDFSNFIMNRLGIDTLTHKLLAGPTYKLIRGSCSSLTELEYHLEEVYKATTDQLDWVNPEGQQYPHNLL
nr:hypothetical protein [Tanacetum cinerariifolium]